MPADTVTADTVTAGMVTAGMVTADYGRVVDVSNSYCSLALMDSGRHPAYRPSVSRRRMIPGPSGVKRWGPRPPVPPPRSAVPVP